MSIPDNYLRALHRPKTLLNSLEIAASVKKSHENHSNTPIPDPKLERHEAPALGGTAKGKDEGVGRVVVRFVGYRVRPLDPDNFAGSVKDLLDGLRHAQIIEGDEPWRIILETEQEQVTTFSEEKTIIEITLP